VRNSLRTFCETVEYVPDELYVGRGAFDVELAPLNKLIIIIIIIIINHKYNSKYFKDSIN